MSVLDSAVVSRDGQLLSCLSNRGVSSKRVKQGLYELSGLCGIQGRLFHAILVQPDQQPEDPATVSSGVDVGYYRTGDVVVYLSAVDTLDDLYTDDDGRLRWVTRGRAIDSGFSVMVI
jgi:hypothetical protein